MSIKFHLPVLELTKRKRRKCRWIGKSLESWRGRIKVLSYREPGLVPSRIEAWRAERVHTSDIPTTVQGDVSMAPQVRDGKFV